MRKINISLFALCVACTQEPQTQQVEEETQPAPEMVTWKVDFGSSDTDEWFALNDDVMGGVSEGDAYFSDSTVVFEGEVSTANNGGFVSLRSPIASYDLSDFSQVEIAYKSQGHSFTMVLANNVAWYMPQFRHEATSASEEWTTVTLPLYDFKQYVMTGYGQSETDVEMSTEHLSDVVQIELINSAFESGEFRLEIDYIEFQGFVDEE